MQQDQTLELAHVLNPTVVKVVDQDALDELDTRLLILNNAHVSTITASLHLRFVVIFSTDGEAGVTNITFGILSLKENFCANYEYKRVLASHQINPSLFLLTITNQSLYLPDSPDKNMWVYYSIMRVTSIVMDGFLVIILTIPLIDKHSKWICTRFTMYHLCIENLVCSSLIFWKDIIMLLYSVFIFNQKRISKHGYLDSLLWCANLAVILYYYLWAVCFLA